MHKYAEYFTQGSNQALALFAVAILWLSMTCVGAWISGKERVIAADIVSGWALISIILNFGGIFSGLSFTVFYYMFRISSTPRSMFLIAVKVVHNSTHLGHGQGALQKELQHHWGQHGPGDPL